MTSLADPFVNLIGYKAPNCLGTGDNGGGLVGCLVGGLVGPKTIKLTEGNCVNFDGFESYKIQIGQDCSSNLIIATTVFTGKDCDRDSFLEEYYPEDEGDCQKLSRGGIDRLVVSASLDCAARGDVEPED